MPRIQREPLDLQLVGRTHGGRPQSFAQGWRIQHRTLLRAQAHRGISQQFPLRRCRKRRNPRLRAPRVDDHAAQPRAKRYEPCLPETVFVSRPVRQHSLEARPLPRSPRMAPPTGHNHPSRARERRTRLERRHSPIVGSGTFAFRGMAANSTGGTNTPLACPADRPGNRRLGSSRSRSRARAPGVPENQCSRPRPLRNSTWLPPRRRPPTRRARGPAQAMAQAAPRRFGLHGSWRAPLLVECDACRLSLYYFLLRGTIRARGSSTFPS
mmetsp:Transcript_47571/g.132650  ORF Transcript_47571/g.132650 Transcript_47571/m.132650 type:complete len:268 (+) Transcript_47571:1288-2091(+)